MSNGNIKYRPEIDGLRSIAVLSVILFHAGITQFSGGFIGVDVFFVISGYLITTILVNEQEKGFISISNFYRRRAKRIIPALFLVIAVTTPAAYLYLAPKELSSYISSILYTATFSSNFLFWQESGYWDTATALKPLIHTWSLAVEEQFYLIFPFIVMMFWRFGAILFSLFLAILMAGSLWLSQNSLLDNPMFSFYMLPARAWELFAGSIIAVLLKRSNIYSSSGIFNQVASIAGLLLIVFPVFYYTGKTKFPGISAIPPVLGAGLIIITSNSNTIVGRILGSKPFVAVGLISYSAYLWHQPVLAFLKIITLGRMDVVDSLLAVGLILILSTITYHLVEKPVRFGHTFFGKWPLLTTGIASCLIIVASFTASKGNGFPDRINSVYSAKAQAVELKNTQSFVSDTAPGENKPIILIIGDSYVRNWSIGLREKINTSKYRVVSLTYRGCDVDVKSDSVFAKPIESAYKENCKYLTDMLNNKNITSHIDKVFLTSHRPFAYIANNFRFNLLKYISSHSNSKLYIFGNYFQYHPMKTQTCLSSMFIAKRDARVCIDSSEYSGNEGKITDKLGLYRPMDTLGLPYTYIDIKSMICDKKSKSCPYEYNGVPFMIDTNHLTATFAKFLIRTITDKNARYFSKIGLSDVFSFDKPN